MKNGFIRAKGRTKRTPGKMNGLEIAWAEHLDGLKNVGEIASWRYEPMNIRLADRCFYNPDFMVVDSQGFVEFHECKGYFEKESKVRVKVVAEQFPEFVFRLIQRRKKKDGGGWEVTVFGPKETGE